MELKAEKRELLGSKVHTLRKEGFIPAELYGRGKENVHLTVNAKEFAKVLKAAGESTVITLNVGKEKTPALIHDVEIDSISDAVLHVDFYAVNMNEETETEVELEFVGESMAVKAEGGVLVKSMHEIEVRALPGDLPHSIEVDLSVLANVHDTIHVKDLKVKGNVTLLADPDAVVATVIEQEAEEEAAPMTVADVKVEGEKKKEESAE
ncbi:MAG: 50S ribosomal protein L25 [Candidatus Wolfebacteria bacterium GW2011_GWE1_48_7]|uniref:Large ribosomal subunit protein bL25 n=1 Tax=Candidatus Wolfebacteria bacterium GW2011_GWB1_47_1 TaxID=1619007 RepID=A0A0G4AR62_9BACT|nr:MAG: ribosomal 5S rRNA E-loop binding protein Ctc/L25/TL5, large subunit ribosomal protein L25 [Candidatus Wolfebacteria bacterium GW2011_GWB1_47_1]KKU36449.1 MAG: 50S ribosomal protein L25 [Candidatus Wolfebacteria bacterium GW2011_GWC2_46_275]KKU41762.1 MAG: 50S ribosomal protein L25 [Candidatus Wolfebacteria bacterium GW2011_GWB2_46_69]KKU53944.1 MAG: 50S ribosomal protein L25 [Candidatus Wolfebacteria bacterium GW2011_GWC1_47_103]KKU59036.1 MAG: 50S ribosomal protein L25 [Candidatus Wolf